MADRPGVMIYLDLRPAIAYLSDEDKGRLLDAILTYAADGQPLEDADGTLAAIWALVQPKIDRDADAHRRKCRKAAYAAYVRSCKQADIPAEPYDVWTQRQSDGADPIATTSPSTSTSTSTYTSISPSAATHDSMRAPYDRWLSEDSTDR